MKLLINKDIEITLKYSDKQIKIELLQHINEDFSPQMKELNVAHSVYYSRNYIRITVPVQKVVLGEVEMNKFLFMLYLAAPININADATTAAPIMIFLFVMTQS